MYCAICGKPGSRSLACKVGDCGRVYCSACLECMAGKGVKGLIEGTPDWQCFVCAEYRSEINGLIKVHSNWQHHVMKFFAPSITKLATPSIPFEKKGLRVLSLFDGIGTGLVALTGLNIEIESYCAAEVDEDSVRLTRYHHGDRVVHLGDVRLVSDEVLAAVGPFDLLIGGSPCNDLSIVNPARKGLYDCSGTGVMFFEFNRILNELRLSCGPNVFWLFENVAAMDSGTKDTISRFFKCEPFLVDAKNFSPQNRARLFWGNIPGMDSCSQYMPKVTPSLASALTGGCGRAPAGDLHKLRTVTTSTNSLRQGPDQRLPVTMYGAPDDIWITELESVFGFPRHYTDLGNLSLRRRQQLLGRAWSVPVVKHLLAPLKSFFKTSLNSEIVTE